MPANASAGVHSSHHSVVIEKTTGAMTHVQCCTQVKGAQCVVLAGDPLQLPPTVLSLRAGTKFGLSVTLFERLQSCGTHVCLQYRGNGRARVNLRSAPVNRV